MTTRRSFLTRGAAGFSGLALSGMLAKQATASVAGVPHFRPRAKRVLFLCMSGGPSHVDTFDYKPALARLDGQSGPATGRRRSSARLMKSPWKFSKHGRSGLPISELFPQVAKQADHLCLLHGMQTSVPAHPQAFLELHTGTTQFVRPSLGSWVVYGLGQENENLPSFISLSPPSGNGGSRNYGNSFLPAIHQGTPIDMRRGAATLSDIDNPRLDRDQQRRQLDLISRLHRSDAVTRPGDDAIRSVAASYELAFRMQDAVPEVMSIQSESEATRRAYGLQNDETQSFGRQCLTARRLLEAGVRFVEITHSGWDQHRRLREDHAKNAAAVDQPIAALLADLQSRGLLEDTLVLWGGEFGRTPAVQGNDGRDHNHKGFTMWMAGGGVRGGYRYGATDELGGEAVDGKMDIHDLHATVLHALGIDHKRLTYRYAGRDFRLTDVHGNVAKEIFV
ncbi:MAG: DUF1501 domain-containing protein [Planctomycetota bacterium]